MDVKIYRNTYRKNGHVGGFIFEIKNHILVIILYIVAFIGLIAGSFLVNKIPGISLEIKYIFENYIAAVPGQTLMKNFAVQLTVNALVILLNILSGLCVIGFPVPFLISFIKGISIGALSAFIYTEYTLSGFGFCMIVFFPVQLIMMLVLIFSGKESIIMSIGLLKTLTEQNLRTYEKYDVKKFILQSLFSILVIVCISFVSALLNVYAIRLFDF